MGNIHFFEDRRLKRQNQLNTSGFLPFLTRCRVIKVYDGDTYTVVGRLPRQRNYYIWRVRIADIDCPELNSKDSDEAIYAKEARDFVSRLILNRCVGLKVFRYEKYGRLLAEVYCRRSRCMRCRETYKRRVSLGKVLLDEGLAVPYDGKAKPTVDWKQVKAEHGPRFCPSCDCSCLRAKSFFAVILMSIIEVLENRIVETTLGDLEDVRELKRSSVPVQTITCQQVVTGSRGIRCLLGTTSDLDAELGIRYRSKSLQQCQSELPKKNEAPLSEGVLWLLLTGEIASLEECSELTRIFQLRGKLSSEVKDMVDRLPKDMHPMTQLSIAVLSLQSESRFVKAYAEGQKKTDFWKSFLDDGLNILAKLPIIASRIYRNLYHSGKNLETDENLDWAGNFGHLLGFGSDFQECLRLYLFLHADHESGNVSAHTSHIVGSALSDIYLSISAGFTGLAGPLHGLANQDSLRWLEKAKDENLKTVEEFTKYAENTLSSGKVIPGFGHAVLRVVDPRYTLQQEFAQKYCPEDELVKLANVCFEAVTPVLQETGKVSNPYPNVDALSGVLLRHFGMTQSEFYTVIFAVARSIGIVAQTVLARRLGLSIERPKSVTLEWLKSRKN